MSGYFDECKHPSTSGTRSHRIDRRAKMGCDMADQRILGINLARLLCMKPKPSSLKTMDVMQI